MKNFWEKFLEFCNDIGTARAATIATRSGKIDLAKEIMTKKGNKNV